MMETIINAALLYMQQPFAWVGLISMTCALIGSLVLALKGKYAGYGWVLFAFSNAGWIVFAYGYEHWFFLVQQIGFSITSALGIWRYLVRVPKPQIIEVAWRRRDGYDWKVTCVPLVARCWREQECYVEPLIYFDGSAIWKTAEWRPS